MSNYQKRAGGVHNIIWTQTEACERFLSQENNQGCFIKVSSQTWLNNDNAWNNNKSGVADQFIN